MSLSRNDNFQGPSAIEILRQILYETKIQTNSVTSTGDASSANQLLQLTALTNILNELRDDVSFSETIWIDKNTNIFYVRLRTVNQDAGVVTIVWQDVNGSVVTPPSIPNLVQTELVNDYELSVTDYRVITAFTNAALNDLIKSIDVVNTSNNTVVSFWRNVTQSISLPTPTLSNLEPFGDALYRNGTQRTQITNGTLNASLTASNTAAVAADIALVTSTSPNSVEFQNEFGAPASKAVLTGGVHNNVEPIYSNGAATVLQADSNGKLLTTEKNSDASLVQQQSSNLKLNTLNDSVDDLNATLTALNLKVVPTTDGIKTKAVVTDSDGDSINVTPLTNANALVTMIVDGNGNQITSFGSPDGSLESTQLLVKAKTDNLDVALSTRLKPSDTLTKVATVDTITNVVSVNDNGGSLTVDAVSLPLPTGASTSSLQTTGNTSLSNIDTKTPALGQALSASSVPVVLPAVQLITLTPPAAITGFSLETTQALVKAKTDNIDVLLSTRLKPSDTLTAVTTVSAVTAITNALPAGTNTIGNTNMTLATAQFNKITDGTNTTAVKAASTVNAATDPSLVVQISKNSPQLQTVGAGTAATNSVLVGGVYNATPPVLTTTQGSALQTDVNGKLQTVSNLGATIYVQSTGNNTAVQLAAAATFTGTIESALSYPQAIISIRADQAITINIDQYSDAAGTIQFPTITYTRTAGQGFNQAVNLAGSYYRLRITNNGGATTTTLFAETWLGILPPLPNLDNNGNLPTISVNQGTSNSGLYSIYRNENLLAATATVKATVGNVYGVNIINTNVVPVYLKFFDAAAVTIGTTAPTEVLAIPASGALLIEPKNSVFSYFQTNSIKIAAVTGVLTASTAAPSTGLVVEIKYV